MTSTLPSKMAAAACLAWAALATPACQSQSSSDEATAASGTIEMPLTTVTNGVVYRLRNVELELCGGPSFFCTFLFDNGSDQSALSTSLPTGSYSSFLDSFVLERGDGQGNFQPVNATVENSFVGFTIFNGATTTIVYTFDTDGVVVTVGAGQLDIKVVVNQVPPACTPFGSDCPPGSWCPPSGLTGMARACFGAGTVGIGGSCSGPNDCVANASCFDSGRGPVCAALCPSNQFDMPCSTGGTCQRAGIDYGICSGNGAGSASLRISAATRTPRRSTWSVNDWTWAPTYGDAVSGSDSLIGALAPALMRVGGYNNDVNSPDPFDDAQLDKAVAYARAIGAEPLIQIPLLRGTDGQPPTAESAAAMMTYANLVKEYGIKYFSIGNEPDLYGDQGSLANPSLPAIPGYSPSAYCASASAFVAQMKQVDPSIQIVGPDLAYKYQPFNDWLTPILQQCGQLFDIVSVHRYPFDHTRATLDDAKSDVTSFRQTMATVRSFMLMAGYGDKPLALTEMNIVYDATPAGSVLAASPGTVPAGLWLVDAMGASADLGLWTTAVWNISDVDEWSLGLLGLPPEHTRRPAYQALSLFTGHAGPTLLPTTQAPAGVNVYASRNASDDGTEVVLVNWNSVPQTLRVAVTDLAATPAPTTIAIGGLTVSAIRIPDLGAPLAWTYGADQFAAGSGPASITPTP